MKTTQVAVQFLAPPADPEAVRKSGAHPPRRPRRRKARQGPRLATREGTGGREAEALPALPAPPPRLGEPALRVGDRLPLDVRSRSARASPQPPGPGSPLRVGRGPPGSNRAAERRNAGPCGRSASPGAAVTPGDPPPFLTVRLTPPSHASLRPDVPVGTTRF